jgi:hypothetical protein
MNTQYVPLLTALSVALMTPVFAQDSPDENINDDVKARDISVLMAQPTIDVTVEGIHMKLWILTPAEHKVIMSGKPSGMKMRDAKDTPAGGVNSPGMRMSRDVAGMPREGLSMNKPMMDSTVTATHHVMLEVTDAGNGMPIPNADATLSGVSPSKKNFSIDLRSMTDHFGGDLALDERGEYRLTVGLSAGGVTKTKEFSFPGK